jgi:cytochrome c biogenesis protein CcmG/thiol:disulfide interchange protein DsbE
VVGKQAPEISGRGLDGKTVSLSSDRGHAVLVNFWASWCIPCRDEFPLLRAALTAHPDLRILGVAFQDAASAARQFADQAHATWPSVVDSKDHHATIWGVRAPPVTVLVGLDGVVRARHIGQLRPGDIDRLLAEAKVAA